MFKLGGYRPSLGNFNFHTFSSSEAKFVKLAASANDTYVIPEFTPISNQGAIGSCVANATADAFEMIKGLEDSSKVEQVSRLFIYYNARAAENATSKDEGCYVHDALSSLAKLGVCRESTWIYDTNQVFTHPPIEAYREGNDNTITAFYQIASSGAARVADIETAIRSNHPVIFGTQVGQEFQDYVNQGEKVFGIPTQSIGGHAMIITGIRTNNGKKEFYIRNSWSDGWGLNGHCWFSEDYIKWSLTGDLFVPTLMPDFTI